MPTNYYVPLFICFKIIFPLLFSCFIERCIIERGSVILRPLTDGFFPPFKINC